MEYYLFKTDNKWNIISLKLIIKITQYYKSYKNCVESGRCNDTDNNSIKNQNIAEKSLCLLHYYGRLPINEQ